MSKQKHVLQTKCCYYAHPDLTNTLLLVGSSMSMSTTQSYRCKSKMTNMIFLMFSKRVNNKVMLTWKAPDTVPFTTLSLQVFSGLGVSGVWAVKFISYEASGSHAMRFTLSRTNSGVTIHFPETQSSQWVTLSVVYVLVSYQQHWLHLWKHW